MIAYPRFGAAALGYVPTPRELAPRLPVHANRRQMIHASDAVHRRRSDRRRRAAACLRLGVKERILQPILRWQVHGSRPGIVRFKVKRGSTWAMAGKRQD